MEWKFVLFGMRGRSSGGGVRRGEGPTGVKHGWFWASVKSGGTDCGRSVLEIGWRLNPGSTLWKGQIRLAFF